ncbi:phi13 family phage major tail protein [Paenibacillus sp. 4624]|uniref:major tail protein n=1 Tax=Paenibacillus sp. 4624 TaxID=3156453 RepID=UPI003D1C2DAE
MSQNKVTYGFDKVHIAFFDKDSTDAVPAWEAPIPVPGAVRWTPEAQGDTNEFYADNTKYFIVTNNNGYTGELEMANIPDELKVRMFGWLIDDKGMLVEIADGVPEKFALLGQVKGDKRDRRFVYYNCQAARTAKENTTKGESTEIVGETLSMSSSPIEIGGRVMVKGDLELSATNATEFNSFFTEVYTPTFTPGA